MPVRREPTASNTVDTRAYVSHNDGATWVPWSGSVCAGADFYATHRPGTNAKASVTVPAPGEKLRLVCTGLTVTLMAGATAPAAVVREVSLINGASGGSSILWGTTLAIPAIAGANSGASPPPGDGWAASDNTPLTLEFESAGGANTVESVTMHGHVESR